MTHSVGRIMDNRVEKWIRKCLYKIADETVPFVLCKTIPTASGNLAPPWASLYFQLMKATFLHPSWRASPASWDVLRLFLDQWVRVYVCIYIIYIYINYVCAHHNALY